MADADAHAVTTQAVVADVFRTEWSRIVAVLVRDIGDLGIAEDAAQEAFIEATTHWTASGLPDRPGAWLLVTARRKAIDKLRRNRRFDALLPIISADAVDRLSNTGPDDDDWRADPTGDDSCSDTIALDEQLALLLGCCHPAIGAEAQIALTLRSVGGLSTAQIARAFFASEATMTRRLTRAKTKIRDAGIAFTLPTVETLAERLGAVCTVIAAIFTEGHASATDASLVRGDLCDEAIWLSELLMQLVPDDPEVIGLHALMVLTDARRSTRVGADGTPTLLADQDRSLWDRARIAQGLAAIAKAYSYGRAGPYQFQAAVAALHATAPTFDDTDWGAIVDVYDALLGRQPTAVVALNRAIAVHRLHGPQAGLDAIDLIEVADDLTGDLTGYPYFHAARAEALAELGCISDSLIAFDHAIDACANPTERAHLEKRRTNVSPHAPCLTADE